MACIASTRCTSVAQRRVAVRPLAPARPVRAAVVPKAFLKEFTDTFAKGLLKIFSPPESTVGGPTSNVDSYPENNFKGTTTSHHDAGRKPFADGWSSSTAAAEDAKKDSKEEEGYLDGAVKRVVNNNFTGDKTEPEWKEGSGWKGDIHTPAGKRDNRDGFHAKKL